MYISRNLFYKLCFPVNFYIPLNSQSVQKYSPIKSSGQRVVELLEKEQ
jgi:hypothetical protein